MKKSAVTNLARSNVEASTRKPYRTTRFPMFLWWLALALLAAVTCELPLAGSTQPPAKSSQAASAQVNEIESITTVGASRYEAGALKRFLFGDDYRDLWTTPIRVPILQLERFEGGLTPFKLGGGGQTRSLHFRAADGRRFVFRSLDKNPGIGLDSVLRGTIVEYIVQDQISSMHPAAVLVVAGLMEAVGVLHATPRLVVLPNTPVLGEYRAEFAGTLGIIAERPNEGEDGSPGFAGSRKITESEAAFGAVAASPLDRFDAQDFLRARLVDLMVGDRDRHKGQWRWARYESGNGYSWKPIPEDRDQAFIRADGLAMGIARLTVREWATFSDRYPSVERLTWEGWDLDRYILPDLSPAEWADAVLHVQRSLTDSVIVDAVHRLPPEFVRLRGEQLIEALRRRRTFLPVVAAEYYGMIASVVDVHGTESDEFVEIYGRGTSVTVRMYSRDADGRPVGEPFFDRRFDSKDTREVRVYLEGGSDRGVVAGRDGGINIRVIGGPGRDELVDSSLARVFFYDEDQADFTRSDRTRVSTTQFSPPPSAEPAHAAPPDWGSWRQPLFGFGASFDRGVFLSVGVAWYRYGFRRYPYASRTRVRAGLLTGGMRPRVELEHEWRHVRRNMHVRLDALASWSERVRFHGFGNETAVLGPRRYHSVNQSVFELATRITYEPHDRIRFWTGPVAKRGITALREGTYLEQQVGLYGTGSVTQVGVRAGFEFDARDEPVLARRSISMTIAGSAYPRLLDLRNAFGEVHGEIAARYTIGPTLAVRAGGKRLWGDYPFYEAAFVGGSESVRGFREERFAGDAAIYGNGEVRLKLGNVGKPLPTVVGLFALGDIGRVFLTGERSTIWHASYGGGVWLTLPGPSNTLSVAAARSIEGTEIHLRAGFLF